jgi:hypothetical protein
MSNDRTVRVTQTATFISKKMQVTEVKQCEIAIGDWCIFKSVDRSNVMLGKVLSMGYLSGTKSTLRELIQTCDPTKENVGVLCVWFSIERNGSNLTGYVHQTHVTAHGLHPCSSYICTLPTPLISNGRFCFHQSVIEQVCNVLSTC